MLRIDPKCGEDAHTLLQKSLRTKDFHMRRRLLALHFVASGAPARVAASTVEVDRIAVSTWVKRFNRYGPEGVLQEESEMRLLDGQGSGIGRKTTSIFMIALLTLGRVIHRLFLSDRNLKESKKSQAEGGAWLKK